MYAFDLPKNILLHVQTPGGGELILLHQGDGKFIASIPPVVLSGISTEPQAQPETGLKATWTTDVPGRGADVHTTLHFFDVAGAVETARAAAEAGDEIAQREIQQIKDAEAAIAAEEAGQRRVDALILPQSYSQAPELILPNGAAP